MACNTRGGVREEVLLAQVDSYLERKDYQKNGRCVRFNAIKSDDVQILEREGRVATFTVDLSFWQFCQGILPGRWITRNLQDEIAAGSFADVKEGPWYELRVRLNDNVKHGYMYPNFTELEPTYFSLVSCTAYPASSLTTMLTGGSSRSTAVIKAVSASPILKSVGAGLPWSLWTFHVGQGMCSLLTDGKEHGILLDAGAGTPLKRPKYQSAVTVMHNDLRTRLSSLKKVDMILSHADRDHYCLLSWDKGLRDKIENIYVPIGAKSILLKDFAVIDKVRESNGNIFILVGDGRLEVFRSEPQVHSSNTDCLVSVYKCDKGIHQVLHCGDYVYQDMRADKNTSISALDQQRYSAVVVPHHGDSASAKNVFTPRLTAHSIAFFSAGDNLAYGHPTSDSRDAHNAAGYKEVCNQEIDHVREVQLVP